MYLILCLSTAWLTADLSALSRGGAAISHNTSSYFPIIGEIKGTGSGLIAIVRVRVNNCLAKG
jgi:hypothetical protein